MLFYAKVFIQSAYTYLVNADKFFDCCKINVKYSNAKQIFLSANLSLWRIWRKKIKKCKTYYLPHLNSKSSIISRLQERKLGNMS